MILPRDAPDGVIYTNPTKMLNAGIWTLFGGASVFLFLRLYTKFSRHTGLWYDDHVLLTSWLVLMVNNIVISIEFATGYVTEGGWDDRMHILINISSCGTLVGQALSKTAFAVTLLRMSNRDQKIILWMCIVVMDGYMAWKCVFQWAKLCGRSDYQQWYRLQTGCINYDWEQDFKVGGNVVNIIMDFVFALFPWWITYPLEMKRVEKIGLCVTMSLGMIVAVVSAIRTGWKDTAGLHKHDDSYMVRNATSMIWYSSEVAGTIIVQCIPILRPFLRDIHTSLTSNRLSANENRSSGLTWLSTVDGKHGSGSAYSDGKRTSAFANKDMKSTAFDSSKTVGATTDIIGLSDIPEDPELDLIDGNQDDNDKENDLRYQLEHKSTIDEAEREIMGWKKGFNTSSNHPSTIDPYVEHYGHKSEAGSNTDMENKNAITTSGPLQPNSWRSSEASMDVLSPTSLSVAGGGSWMDFLEKEKDGERSRMKGGDEEKNAVGVELTPLATTPRTTINFSRGGR